MKSILKSLPVILIIILSFVKISQAQTPAEKINGIIEKTFYSKTLNEDRRLFIYTPKLEEGKTYPVLYLLDGERTELFNEALNTIQAEDEVGPHIIVGIETVKNRNRHMIPQKIKLRSGSGDADKFLEFLTTELIPFVNKTLPTNGNNILYGGSNAGLFSIYALLEKPEAFNSFIASSPMIGWCPDFMNKMAKLVDLKIRLKNKRLLIHYGMKDRYKQVTEYVPKYYKLLSTKFKDILYIKMISLENAGHVPHGGIQAGLEFIYNKN